MMALGALDKTKSVLLTPTASSDLLIQKSNRAILLFPRNSEIASKLAFEAKKHGYKKVIAAYARNSVYSTDIFNEFKKDFTDRYHRLIPVKVRAGTANPDVVGDLIRKNQDYDAIFLPLFELDVARILSGLAAAHIRIKCVIG